MFSDRFLKVPVLYEADNGEGFVRSDYIRPIAIDHITTDIASWDDVEEKESIMRPCVVLWIFGNPVKVLMEEDEFIKLLNTV